MAESIHTTVRIGISAVAIRPRCRRRTHCRASLVAFEDVEAAEQDQERDGPK